MGLSLWYMTTKKIPRVLMLSPPQGIKKNILNNVYCPLYVTNLFFLNPTIKLAY